MTTSGSDWSETLSYTYDCKGNIETISENGEQKAKYYYDALNQLVREDNAWTNKTVVYTYDNGGNILNVSEYALTSASDISALVASSTDTYAYTDSNWKDKLTSYNGNEITYDEIGNPLTYYNGYEFDWQNGRQLVSVSASDLSVSYKYNSDGIRTSKTVNGVTTTYTLEGSNILKETNGTDTIWYYYDASGSLTGFDLNGTPYFYVKNVQGDIVAITNASGNIVVEYVYDSWGKLISITGSLASTVGTKNPFRYRGYYYDTETCLYYLNSRYYAPSIKRFINADGYTATGQGPLGNNMYAYCANNSIRRKDSTGEIWWIIPIVIIPFILTGCSSQPVSSSPRSDLANAPDLDVDVASPTSYNCYGNGIGKQISTNPTGYVRGDSTRKTFETVKNDLGSDYVRELDSIDAPINEDEFKVALKCGPTDYHFIRLTDNGWYNKSGRVHSGLYVDQSDVASDVWIARAIINGEYYEGDPSYTYETIYFAVKAGWDTQ